MPGIWRSEGVSTSGHVGAIQELLEVPGRAAAESDPSPQARTSPPCQVAKTLGPRGRRGIRRGIE